MQTTPLKKTSITQLGQLSSFAGYLLANKLREFSILFIHWSKEFNLPMLKHFEHLNEEEIISLGEESNREFLTYLAGNKASEQIQLSIKRWVSNQLPRLDKYEVRAEDINLITYIRKRVFLYFIPGYCRDTEQALELVNEIDLFCLESEMAATNTYIEIIKNKANENAHLIENINNTIPGAVYVFDVVESKGIYSNNKLASIIGYTQQELNSLGTGVIQELIHPDDRVKLIEQEENFRNLKDGMIISCIYRIRNKNGGYQWLRNYESVFKRKEDGTVWQKIGITLNIDKEQKIEVDLRQSDQRYKQTEALAHIGNYVWNLQTGELTWSDELYRIYGLDPQKLRITNELAQSINHPDDQLIMSEEIRKARDTGSNFDFYYRILPGEGVEKILHARGSMVPGSNGEPIAIIGTVQDETEKQNLIRSLRHSEVIHKQAEELANLGSWVWELTNNTIEWSDQMYRIYEVDRGERIDFNRFLSFIHPKDREGIRTISEVILNQKQFEQSFRIITSKGNTRKVHTIARLFMDSQGNPSYIIGAEQDITEKETLVEELRKSAELYKQAEELANMGNWSWDLRTNKITWTDQLYRIYGIEPRSEEISIESFISFVHPEDQAFVKEGVETLLREKKIDSVFRIVTRDGTIKVLRSVAQVQTDENGQPSIIVGTERDITEKQTLINQLKHSEYLYKQAQALAHVGNWSWDLKTNNLEWSDELFCIYGLEPQSLKPTFDKNLSFVHPDDLDKVRDQIRNTLTSKTSCEFIHRIVRADGDTRILFVTGEFFSDEKGEPYQIIGTTQDVTERQTLIDKLQESEKLYKQAQNLAQMGNWTLDLKTNRLTWSEEMFNIYEMEKTELLNFDQWFDYLTQEDAEEVKKYFEDCLREKKIYDKVHKVQLQNGRVKMVHRKGEFVYDEKGEPVKMIGTTQDVTEDYRVQQELKDNQTFIRKITDATPSIISSYNINTGKYVFISEGLEKLLGYSTEEVMEKGVGFFVEIIHPDDLMPMMNKNNKALQEANEHPEKGDFVVEFTYRMRHKLGHYRWFHTYGTIFDRNRNGQVEHVLNISLDITDQMEAAEKIKEQEHFIQQIADASPTILYLYDVPSQSIVYINREIFFVLGYLPEEIMEAGEGITEMLYNPEDYALLPGRKQSGKNFQQVDSMIQYECRMKNKEGDWRWLLVREIVFKTDEEGNISQILGAALDINRRKDMEKTILQNTMLLEQSNASLEEFAYVASHDLKEPLRKISTFGDRLVATQMENLAPEGRIYLQKIVDASQRMQIMINDLLSISMISGNIAFENFSLQKILEETLQTLEFKIEQQSAIIRSEPLPEAKIIPSQFRQLFQNLLSNSLKFIKPDVQPVITISHSYLNQGEVTHYQLTEAERYHKIEFSDNGIGFENEFAGKIFAIFQRLHGRSEYEGSGIGLAICKKIVEHHGGIIYASGVQDIGATFTIILPA